ncbi:MAG: M28 family peptidase [Bacteroidia bacterium]|nr:M28 family peptidase [Bacteroidia bacterium]
MRILVAFVICFIFLIQSSFSQNHSAFYQSVVNDVKYDSVLNYLKKVELLGVKSPGTNALVNAKNWLVNKYTSFGYSNIQIDTFTDNGDVLYNVIVTKTGTLYPNTYLIVCGHYDSKSGWSGGSPGVNDNGSGVSVILEIARLLKNVNTEYSIKFINFTAEETGYTGSLNYLNNIVIPQNLDIRLVFNIDEVGGVAGQVNDIIKCESDQSSPLVNNVTSAAFTDTLMTLTSLYSNLGTNNTNAYGSDYVPFQNQEYIITGYFENNQSPVVHSSNDDLSHLDTSYVYEIAQAATGATLYLARAYENSNVISEQETNVIINVFPTPVQNQLNINSCVQISKIEIFDIQGKLVLKMALPNQYQNSISFSDFKNGIYHYRVIDTNGDILKSGTLVKATN